MHALQITVVIFSIFALSRLILRRRDRTVPLGELIFWSVIWIGAILLALFPKVINAAAEWTGFSNTIDLIIIIAILALFYLLFRVYVKVEQQGQDVTRLIREMALRERKKK